MRRRVSQLKAVALTTFVLAVVLTFAVVSEVAAAPSTWSVTPSPNGNETIPFESSTNALLGVSCITLSDCIAVGYNEADSDALIETWNGATWSIETSPPANGYLQAISYTGPTFCVAVGYQEAADSNDYYNTLIESWDGSGWSIVSSPNPSSPFSGSSDFNGV